MFPESTKFVSQSSISLKEFFKWRFGSYFMEVMVTDFVDVSE